MERPSFEPLHSGDVINISSLLFGLDDLSESACDEFRLNPSADELTWKEAHGPSSDCILGNRTSTSCQTDSEVYINRGAYATPCWTLTRFLLEQPYLLSFEGVGMGSPEKKGHLPGDITVTCGNVCGANSSFLAARMSSFQFDTDIVALQEVSPEKPPYLLAYPYRTVLTKNSRANVQTMICSRYAWSGWETWGLPGTLNYDNCVSFARYGDILAVGCVYLQAGSALSCSIEPWARPLFQQCRACAIRWAVAKLQATGCHYMLLMGDFNVDHNGQRVDWPEIETLYASGLDDIYASDRFITEDSETNLLREKNEFPKQVRFDAAWSNAATRDREIIWDDAIDIEGKLLHRSDHWGLKFTVELNPV